MNNTFKRIIGIVALLIASPLVLVLLFVVAIRISCTAALKTLRYLYRLSGRITRYLRRLSQVWLQPVYFGMWSRTALRYKAQAVVTSLNSELYQIARATATDPAYFISFAALVTLTLSINLTEINHRIEIIGDILTVLIGSVTLFITVAIFMATRTDMTIKSSVDAKTKLKEKLAQYDENLYDLVASNFDRFTIEEVYMLLYTLSFMNVNDQGSYRSFRDWILLNKTKFPGPESSWWIPAEQTYHIALNGYHRGPACILEAYTILKDKELLDKDHMKKFNKLRIASTSYLNSNQYAFIYSEHSLFLGLRLKRLVYITIFAVISSYMFANLLVNRPDVISYYNFHSTEIIAHIITLLVIVSAALNVRYLLMLVNFFHRVSQSTHEGYVYFYPESTSEGAIYTNRIHW